MKSSIEDYYTSDPFVLPIQHEKGFGITDYFVQCGKCQALTEDLRGDCLHFSTCLELRVAGVCHECKVVTWSRLRFYGDHFLRWRNGRIEEHWPKRTWRDKTVSALRSLKILR